MAMELQLGAITELDGLRSRYVLCIINYQSVERASDYLFGTDDGTRIFTHLFVPETSDQGLICTLCSFPRINHVGETELPHSVQIADQVNLEGLDSSEDTEGD